MAPKSADVRLAFKARALVVAVKDRAVVKSVMFALVARVAAVAVLTGFPASVVLSALPRPTIVAVSPPTVPVKVVAPVKAGLARFAFKPRAVAVAVLTGFAASVVLLTLPSPTMVAVMPVVVPTTFRVPATTTLSQSLIPLGTPVPVEAPMRSRDPAEYNS